MFENCNIESAVIHHIGHKPTDEGITFSKAPLTLNGKTQDNLLSYFLSSFKFEEYFNLYHESDLNLNEVYSFATQIFNDPDLLYEQSVNLAKHLYEQSNHPKIKVGEFFIVYFSDCQVGRETVEAIGLIKAETKDTFLKVLPDRKSVV